jgi:hypothetical protein
MLSNTHFCDPAAACDAEAVNLPEAGSNVAVPLPSSVT